MTPQGTHNPPIAPGHEGLHGCGASR